MKNTKRFLATIISILILATTLAGCTHLNDETQETQKSQESKDANFTWWIVSDDGEGTYYEKYEDNPVIQWINAQYWDVEKGGLGTEDDKRQLNLSFLTPIAGSEDQNFNTMISTGEYPEIVNIDYSSDNADALYANGIAIDLTEYVNAYMPNYLRFLEEHPDLKNFVTYQDEEGNTRYYSLARLMEGTEPAWEGYCYRRDWVVKYCKPSAYVWDWESDYVAQNGHPKYTPLSAAENAKDFTGWKKNDITKFTATPGDDPNETYTDNVVFPSGTSDPLYISDWEWMFEGFEKALMERGWAEDKSQAYAMSIPYQGFVGTGDLVSSFGGGSGTWYYKDGTFSFDGASDNFKAYVECMKSWNEKGWLDGSFETRSSDMFWSVNTFSVSQGKVGMWLGMKRNLGTSCRTTCANEEDAADCFVMGCALPINDVYGDEEQKFKEPDCLFQTSAVGSAIILTDKCKEKDLETLFTLFDWLYTLDGGLTTLYGLTAEQYESMSFNPDVYAEYELSEGYTLETSEGGRTLVKRSMSADTGLVNAAVANRLIGLDPKNTSERLIDTGDSKVVQTAADNWGKFTNTGGYINYSKLLTKEETQTYGTVNTAVSDCMYVYVPHMIKGACSWEEYVERIHSINGIDDVVAAFQNHVVE
jgi:hypothetical protein